MKLITQIENLKKELPILEAVKDGKSIQVANLNDPTIWRDCAEAWMDLARRGAMIFHWNIVDYRIKPEPQVKWLNEYSDGWIAGYPTEEAAKKAGNASHVRVAVKYQEVL